MCLSFTCQLAIYRGSTHNALILLQHVGFADYAAIPTSRGWEKSFNYYGGSMGYYSKLGWDSEGDFLDIHENGAPDREPRHVDPGLYSGLLWQERAEQVISEHSALGTDQVKSVVRVHFHIIGNMRI